MSLTLGSSGPQGFGGGLGTVIGSSLAEDDLSKGLSHINDTSAQFRGATEPYNQFGQSFLSPASGAIGNINATAGRDPNLNYNTFMSNYETSPAAKYEIDLANKEQNSSAAAKGQLLSGANERALATVDTGIADQFANKAFTNYLSGNNQQFGQLESALGNMFNAIGVGTTATGQQASVDTAQMSSQAAIAAAQAKNDQGKGAGLGSMFNSVGSLAMMF